MSITNLLDRVRNTSNMTGVYVETLSSSFPSRYDVKFMNFRFLLGLSSKTLLPRQNHMLDIEDIEPNLLDRVGNTSNMVVVHVETLSSSFPSCYDVKFRIFRFLLGISGKILLSMQSRTLEIRDIDINLLDRVGNTPNVVVVYVETLSSNFPPCYRVKFRIFGFLLFS